MEAEPSLGPGAIERWALLIGIDYYMPGTAREVKINHLKGCVRDVLAVEGYLKSIGVPEGRIIKLTASEADGDSIKEPPSLWPTRNNIVGELDHIQREAAEGALVYIHYSGHGILRRTIKGNAGEGGNTFTGTALVPTDVLTGGAYVSGYQLGVKIKQMVEFRGLRITLVLDSCHSGQGLRHDDGSPYGAPRDEDGHPAIVSRFIDEVDDSELDSDKAADRDAAANEEHRTAGAEPRSWLDDPRSCTVLTACGVLETAKEMAFGSVPRERSGVLTHWMLDMLRQYPAARPPSYSQVRNYIQPKTAEQLQTPGIFGDAAYEFFGPKQLPWTPSCGISKKDGEYILAAGKAQGVARGAIYELLPRDLEANTDAASGVGERPLQILVGEVFDLRSKATAVSEDDVPSLDNLINSGHRAVLHKWALPRKTYVELGVDNPQTTDRAFLNRLRAELEKELETTPNLLLKTPDVTKQEDFRMVVDENRIVEIRDGGGRPLVGLPRISLGQSGATGRLVDAVKHVARFRAIKELYYGRPTGSHLLSRDRFSFEAYDLEGELVKKNDSGEYMATDNQRLNLVFRPAKGSEPLYVSVFDLAEDNWTVTKMYPPQKVQPYQLQHPESVEIDTRMRVPAAGNNNAQPRSARDTIRAYVYAGSSLPSWDELQLQELAVAPGGQPDVPAEGDYCRLADLDDNFDEDGRWAIMDFTVVTSQD
ncbi:hypothetical protein RB595_010464 [Gaeumannomyces hyphopodioides]